MAGIKKKKKKKFKSGKIKRHQFRKLVGLSQGFGKPWSAPSVTFRVEFMWVDPEGEESNEQVHWIQCRRFQGEERRFLAQHYQAGNDPMAENESIESKFVCVYTSKFLVENKDKLHINQAFIFPTTKEGNETIRMPIYQIKWSEDLAKSCVFNNALNIVFKNSIYHKH